MKASSPWDEPTRALENEGDYLEQQIEPDTLPVGTQVGRYFIGEPIGEGGMGVVYKARDPQLDRTVALKVLRKGRRAHSESDLELLVEAQTLAKIEHPNIVTIYDAGFTDNQVFLAMALCEGQTLGHHLAQGEHGVREILDLFIAAGRGLAAAHRAGVVHRDFKPANVLIDKDGAVRVADFGMARLMELVVEEDSEPLSIATDTDHDRSVSTIVGTPTYMAPEQLLGRLGDHRMDQWSLCLCLYTALLGRPPFPGSTFQERRLIVPLGLGETERELLNRSRNIPTRVRRAVLKGLSIDPYERFESMDALLDQLSERRRRPWITMSVTLALGLGVGILATVQMREGPCRDPGEVLDPIWSAPRAEQLATTLDDIGHPDAAGQKQRVTSVLDAYAESWKASYTDACEATHVTREQSESLFDQRMQCLQRRRSRLEAAIEVLGTATDPASLDRRMPVVFQLPAIDECNDVEALESRVPMPADAEQRRVVEALYERIDRADTMREAGSFEQGLELAQQVVDEARALDYEPALAVALESLGRLQADGSSPDEAERTLREAIMVASRGRDVRLVARIWPSLIYALTLGDQLEVGEQLEFAARAAVEQSDDDLARAWLLNSLGGLHSDKREYVVARQYFQQALRLKVGLSGAQSFDVGIAWNNLGLALIAGGQLAEAEDAFGQGQAIFEATIGPQHPYVGLARSGLCRVAWKRKRYEDALPLCREAMERLEASSASPELLARTQHLLAQSLWELGRRDEALEMGRRAQKNSKSRNITKWIDGRLEKLASPPPTSPPDDTEAPQPEPPASDPPQPRSGGSSP